MVQLLATPTHSGGFAGGPNRLIPTILSLRSPAQP